MTSANAFISNAFSTFRPTPRSFSIEWMLIFFGACLCSAGLQPSVRMSLMQISRLSALRLAAQKEAPGQVRCENMAAAILGIGIKITRLVGMRKLSQTRKRATTRVRATRLLRTTNPRLERQCLPVLRRKPSRTAGTFPRSNRA